MTLKTHNANLDFGGKRDRPPYQMTVRQGEDRADKLVTAIPDALASAATAARFDMLHEDGTWARFEAQVDIPRKELSATFPSEALNSPGLCEMAHFWVRYGTNDDVVTSEDIMLRILPAVDVSDPARETGCYDDRLNRLHDDMSEFDAAARQAEASRASAEALRADAEDNREVSEELRDSAEDARYQAETDRQSAEASRVTAEQSRGGGGIGSRRSRAVP